MCIRDRCCTTPQRFWCQSMITTQTLALARALSQWNLSHANHSRSSLNWKRAWCSRTRSLKVKAAREQIPLTIATASTLYTLQGATTTPVMIYNFRTPRRISGVMKWIATHMALSRVQSLQQLRSIVLAAATRDIIDGGPHTAAAT